MNKKLLLLTLPALLVMSSCTYMQSATVQREGELLAESTEANEEIFGAAKELKLQRNEPLRLNPLGSDFVKIGYQIKFDNNNTDDPSDDLLSVRFIAAIKDAGVTASWKRGLAQPNGYEGAEPDHEGNPGVWKYKFSEDAKESKKIYSSLTDGENVITAGVDDYVDYVGFVIYSLTNIPYAQFSDAYLAAYVTIADESDGENSINSKGLALFLQKQEDVDRLSYEFCFDPSSDCHFLSGTIGGVDRNGSDNNTHKLLIEDETTVDSASNYASFSDVNLSESDCFGAFYYSPTHFQFFGLSSFFGQSRGFFNETLLMAEHAVPCASGNYSLYIKNNSNLSEENYMYAYANSFVTDPTDVFFKPGVWDVDSAIFRMYCWKGGADTWVSPKATADIPGQGKMCLFEFDAASYDNFKFVRLDPAKPDSWDGKWNETGNYNFYDFFHINGPKSSVVVNNWDDYQIAH